MQTDAQLGTARLISSQLGSVWPEPGLTGGAIRVAKLQVHFKKKTEQLLNGKERSRVLVDELS